MIINDLENTFKEDIVIASKINAKVFRCVIIGYTLDNVKDLPISEVENTIKELETFAHNVLTEFNINLPNMDVIKNITEQDLDVTLPEIKILSEHFQHILPNAEKVFNEITNARIFASLNGGK